MSEAIRKLLKRKRPRTKPGESKHEMRFKELWAKIGGPRLLEQLQAVPGRKFALDFAHPESKVGIETHGGIWNGGRHVRGEGFSEDRIKMNLLALDGWAVIELVPECINEHWLRQIQAFIYQRLGEKEPCWN